MTLAQLKSVCAAILGKTTADFTIDGVDMFLTTANNVRKNAEQLHDFEYTRVAATLDIDGASGGALADAVIENETSYPLIVTVTDLMPSTPSAIGTYELQPTLLNEYAWWLRQDGNYRVYFDGSAWKVEQVADSNMYWDKGLSETPDGSYLAAGTAAGEVIVTSGDELSRQWNGIKSITAIERARADGSYIPLDFTSNDSAIERERSELELSDDMWPSVRYPSDAQYLARGSTSTIIQRNGSLYVYPFSNVTTTPLSVRLLGYAWLADYTASDLLSTTEKDFFLSKGSRYMQWAIVCELNYIFQRFVPRQEGVLAPPEKAREEAWRDFVLWDEYLVDPNSTVSR